MCIHNTLYHSMIFKTITDNLGNTKLSFSNSLKSLFSGDFFKKQSILSDSDIISLKTYNAELEKVIGYEVKNGQVIPITTSAQTAFNRTMQDASVEAQNMAAAANGMVVNLEQIPKVSKAGQVALKGLAIAGNMLAMWGISVVISKVAEGIQYLTSANERYLESQQEIVDKTNEQIAKYDEEIKSLSDLQDSLVEAKGNKEKLAQIQNEINNAIGETPGLLNGNDAAWSVANQKIIDRIALLQKLREEELTKNIQATQNIYNNKEVDNDWGKDRKLTDYFDLESSYYSELRTELNLGLTDSVDIKEYADLYKEYIYKAGTDAEESFAEILADYGQDFLTEGALSHLPNAEEIQTYLDNQYNTISPLFSDYISNLETILPEESLNNILRQLVYMNPDDAEAVEEQFKAFIAKLQNSGLEDAYNKYLESLSDKSLDSEKLYEELRNIINSLSDEFIIAKQDLDSFFRTAGTNPFNVGITIGNATKKKNSFANAISDSEEYSNYLDKFQTLAESGSLSSDVLSSTEEYSNLLQTLGYSADDAVSSLKELFGILDYGNMMDGLEDSLSPIINAQLELSKNGKLSFDTTQALLDIQPNFIDQLQVVEGGYITTDTALQNLIDTKLQSFELDNNEAVKTANKVIESLGGESIAYGLTTDEIIKQLKAEIALFQTKQIKANQTNHAFFSAAKSKNIGLLGSGNILTNGYISDNNIDNDIQLHTGNTGVYSDEIDQLTSILEQIETAQTNTSNALEIYEQLKQQLTDSFNSSSSSGTSQTFDWIETKLNSLAASLDKLKTKANNTYTSWTTRNTELANAIAKTKEAIDLQEQAYKRYIEKANLVGLPDTYAKLIQNGSLNSSSDISLDISPITDETLKTQISEYQTWYEKAQACLETQDDLNTELNELKSQDFANIKSEYDAVTGRMQSAYDLLEAQISLLSSSGDYDTLRNKESDIISKLQAERTALRDNLKVSGIRQYTEEWYNLVSQIDDLDSQIVDSQNALKDIDNLQFNNLKEAFDFDTTILEHGMQKLQNKIDLLELKGQFANESYYNGMLEYTQAQLKALTNERAQLQAVLNNSLYKQGTSEWNSMYSALMDIDEEIDSMTNNIIEYNNAIRNLNWETFEYLEESINRITDETDYLIDLLSHKDLYDSDTGNLTKYAEATIALYAAAYDTYKQQAQDYYEEVLNLQKQLVDGAGQEVLEHYNEMVETHRNAVLAAEEEKRAILDLIEDGYNEQLNALQNLIDKKKEQLSAEKNLYDYQKNIEEQTANISSLEKQKLAYEGDTSEEAISKIQQIKVQLEEAKADLKETEYEQYLQDSENMLDRLSEDYQEWMNSRLDNEDTLLSEIVSSIAVKGDEINGTLNEVADEYGTLVSDAITSIFNSASPFTSTLSQGFSDINSKLVTGLNDVSTSISGTTAAITKLVEQVAGLVNIETGKTNAESGTDNSSSDTDFSTSLDNKVPAASNTGVSGNSSGNTNTNNLSTTKSDTSSTAKAGSTLNDSNSEWGSWFVRKLDTYPKDKLNKDTSIVDRLKFLNYDSTFSQRAKYYSAMGGTGTYTGSSSQNNWMLSQMKSHNYSKGARNIPYNQFAWTQEEGGEVIYRAADGALLTPLGQGDMVFTNEMSHRLWEMAQGNIVPSLATPNVIPDLTGIGGNQSSQTNVGDITVNMELPNVADYKDFRNQLISDSTFEKAMFSSINHALTGKGTPFDKLKHTR